MRKKNSPTSPAWRGNFRIFSSKLPLQFSTSFLESGRFQKAKMLENRINPGFFYLSFGRAHHFWKENTGVAPQASRESHFVGFAIFLPAFCIDIYFIALTQTCGAHFAHPRFFLFFILKFCARAYSGYLFRQRFPAAGCRVQVANFMLMRFAIFLARAYSLHRFCYSNLASHIVWCLFFVECTSRLQTSSYGARFLVHRKNQPARKPPGFSISPA